MTTVFVWPEQVWGRLLVVLALAGFGHLIVYQLRKLTEFLIKPGGKSREQWARRFPKIVTVLSLTTSVLTFVLYFGALGFFLVELGVPISAYVASASVIGLAVAFGSQGLVQDFVVGLTLIFSDVFDVGDLVDAGGQTGRVHSVGLRFTVLTNSHGKKIFLSNRNISQINQYPNNQYSVFVDVEIPEDLDSETFVNELVSVAQGIRHQFPQIVRSEPEFTDIRAVGTDQWEYLRIRFFLWPGQSCLIDTTFKNRALQVIRRYDPDYPDWKLTVTSRGD